MPRDVLQYLRDSCLRHTRGSAPSTMFFQLGRVRLLLPGDITLPACVVCGISPGDRALHGDNVQPLSRRMLRPSLASQDRSVAEHPAEGMVYFNESLKAHPHLKIHIQILSFSEIRSELRQRVNTKFPNGTDTYVLSLDLV